MLVANELREPDLVLVPEDNLSEEADSLFDNIPRVIVEVEIKHRTARGLITWCRGYLRDPQVRQVIGIKFYPRRVDGTFAALALQFGRGANGRAVATKAVSFGTADVHPSAGLQPFLQNGSLPPIDQLLPYPTAQDIARRVNPWDPVTPPPSPPVTPPPSSSDDPANVQQQADRKRAD